MDWNKCSLFNFVKLKQKKNFQSRSQTATTGTKGPDACQSGDKTRHLCKPDLLVIVGSYFDVVLNAEHDTCLHTHRSSGISAYGTILKVLNGVMIPNYMEKYNITYYIKGSDPVYYACKVMLGQFNLLMHNEHSMNYDSYYY